MIFLTVGTQLPFDRLVAAVDAIAEGLDEPVVAQIGHTQYVPRRLDWHVAVSPQDFDRLVGEARLLIAHAGTGSVLAAKRHRKPIILVPRRSSLGEHRNDHQLATCKQFERMTGIYVAYDVADLASLVARTDLEFATEDHQSPQRRALVDQLRGYLSGTK